jgi:hypothetical protein
MEIIKIIVSAITPVAVVVLGVILLRKIEGIKAEVAKNSAFISKWAEEFWITCQEFMKCTERYMTLLHQLASLLDKDDDVGKKYQRECTELNAKLPELELRIRRLVTFAPKNGKDVIAPAKDILSMLSSILKTGKGNFDDLFSKVDSFNQTARSAHAEMMGIKDAKKPFNKI